MALYYRCGWNVLRMVIGIMALIMLSAGAATSEVSTFVPNSSSAIPGYRQITTGENTYSQSLAMSQIKHPLILLTSAQLDNLSADDSSYTVQPGTGNKDELLYVNFTLSGVQSVNWLTVKSITSVNTDTMQLGLWNETSPAGGGWTRLNSTAITGSYVTLTYNVSDIIDIQKYTEIDADNNLNFSMAVWTSGSSGSTLSVDLFEVSINYMPTISADSTPPDSITSLVNVSYAPDYINWTWIDPIDPDFNGVMVYLDGMFKTNVSKGIQYYYATLLNPDRAYTINTRTFDSAGNINLTWVNHTARTRDTVPPGSVTNLMSVSYSPVHINWTWKDPSDPDFSKVMVYINGNFTNYISKGVQYYNLTNLTPGMEYTLSTRTVDTSGNINLTWVNHTESARDDVPPGTITYLRNISFASNYIDWAWIDPIDPDFSRVMIYLDGIFRTNVTKGVQYYKAINLTGGRTYTMSGKTVDVYGNINATAVSYTAVTAHQDMTPPASITNLWNISYAQDYINWTWTDPTDLDFSNVMIYLDGIFRTNISKGVQYYRAINLTGGRTYTLSGRTVDTSGNINSTIVSHTSSTAPADTAPPASITNLTNISFAQFYIKWTWTDSIDPDFSKVMVYLNGNFKTNISKGVQYYNATSLIGGRSYTLSGRTVDASGNINATYVNHTAITDNNTTTTFVVNADGGADYTRIQDAIDSAGDGYTILVSGGSARTLTYYENVNVNKQLFLRGIDEGYGLPVVDAGGIGSVITLRSEGSIVENFIVRNSGTAGTSPTYAGDAGIAVYSNNNTIRDNIISNNGFAGISLKYSSNNIIDNNSIHSSYAFGVYLDMSPDNAITGNNISFNNQDGVLLDGIGSTNNTVINNVITHNFYGLVAAFNNYIYNNYFNNTYKNAGVSNWANIWNTTKTPDINIIGGSYLGGNYWADPSGTGFSQTCVDSDDDGLCDSPYTLPYGNNTDFLPLAQYTADTVPPAGITNLTNISYAPDYINWTWTDPIDIDFSKVMVYLNGNFKANISKGIQYYNATLLIQDTMYTISTRTTDNAGNINTTWINHTARTRDTIPPGSITNLINVSYAPDYIYWIWTDPADADYDHAEVYVDGMYKGNVAKGVQYYNATGFSSDTQHIIATRTVDTSGNINQTFVNHTAKTRDIMPPASITNLSNISYAPTFIDWTWIDPIDPDFSRVMIYLDGVFRTNASRGVQNYSATGFSPDTQHTIATRTVDTSGNINETWINHTARTEDTIPPGSITDLINVSYAPDYIYWIWIDPADADYDHAEVYVDGISKGNVVKGVQYYNATGLSSDTQHTISTRTVDTSGNINQTWINHTASTKDTVPPGSITNLWNINYASDYIDWTWIDPIDPDFSRVMIYLDGIFRTNVSKGIQYYRATNLTGGRTYTLSGRTVDINGNINATMVSNTASTILPAVRYINGTVKESGTSNGIPGVTVSTNTSNSTMTSAAGFYSLAVAEGTYALTARMEPTHYANSSVTVSTVGSAVVVQDIELVMKPTGTITGNVTNA